MIISITQTENYFYILNAEGEAEPAHIDAWAEWRATHDCQIGLTEVGDATVSTVFLGYDMSRTVGERRLFETMIFGGRHDRWQARYSTRSEAEAGHARAVAMVTASFPGRPESVRDPLWKERDNDGEFDRNTGGG